MIRAGSFNTRITRQTIALDFDTLFPILKQVKCAKYAMIRAPVPIRGHGTRIDIPSDEHAHRYNDFRDTCTLIILQVMNHN